LSLNMGDSVDFPSIVFIVVAVITSVSGIHYIVKGLKLSADEQTN
jgi:hypothetical protein